MNKIYPTTHIKIFLSLFLCLIFIFISSSSYAFHQELQFNQLNDVNGLAESPSYSVAQDSYGFIWVATQDGLNRYDGENLIQYRKNTIDENSLADNFVRKVFIDSNDTLWIGTENGLSKYNRNKNNFENFYTSNDNLNTLTDNLIWDIYEDNKGSILVSTENGLHKYIEKDNAFIPLPIRGFEKQLTAIKTIYQDNNNNYWLGTFDNGIYITNSKLANAFSLQESNPWSLNIPSNRLFDIKLIEEHYWLGTDTGLYILDTDYNLTSHLTTSSNKKNQTKLTSKQLFLSSNNVRSIEQLNQDIWLGTENGINIINKAINNISIIKQREMPQSLTSNKVINIFIDKNKNAWVANILGLNLFNKNQIAFTHYLNKKPEQSEEIEAIVKTSNNNIWFLSNRTGLKTIDNQNNIITLQLSSPPLITILPVMVMTYGL